MIVAVALSDFSAEAMNQPQQQANEDSSKKSNNLKQKQEEISSKIDKNTDETTENQNDDSNEKSDKEQSSNIQEKEQEESQQKQNDKGQTESDVSEKTEVKNEKIGESNESTQQQQQSQQQQGMQYLSFKKDDRIIVKYQHENGWWWGCLLGIRNPVDGYFPSTYVRLSHKIGDDFEDDQKGKNEQDIEKMGWQEYAQFVKRQAFEENIDNEYEKFMNDTVEKREENLDKFLNPGIKGFKKVKIDPSLQDSYKNIQGSFFSKEGDTVFIPIKSQDPLDRACRQLNHYFNYDAWNEQMNSKNQRKAKPNPNKKREKNENKFLEKLK